MDSTIKFFSHSEGPDWSGFLDHQACIEGTLNVPGTFRLDGTLRGRILSRHTLVLGETAGVDGDIEGECVVIFGRFRGTLRAKERVEIHPGAAVLGDVYTPCLVLEPGSRFNGHCFLNPPGEQAEPVLVPVRTDSQDEEAVESQAGRDARRA